MIHPPLSLELSCLYLLLISKQCNNANKVFKLSNKKFIQLNEEEQSTFFFAFNHLGAIQRVFVSSSNRNS